MRSHRLASILAGSLLLGSAHTAAACPCRHSAPYQECAEIAAFLAAKKQTSANVLAFNHSQQAWSAWTWDGEKCLEKISMDRIDFEIDFTGKATLAIPRKTPLVVLVTDTNPLLFTASAVESAEVSRPDLAAIQAVALGIGRFVSGVVAEMPQRSGEVEPGEGGPAIKMLGISPSENADLLDLARVAQQLGENIITESEPPTKAKEKATDLARTLAKTIQRVDLKTSGLRAYLQKIESGTAPEPAALLSKKDGLNALPQDVAKQHGDFLQAAKSVETNHYVCAEKIKTLGEIITLQLRGVPSDPYYKGEIVARYADKQRVLRAAECEKQPLTQGIETLADQLAALFKKHPNFFPQLEQAAASSKTPDKPVGDPDLKKLAEQVSAPLKALAEVAAQYAAAATERDALLAEVPKIRAKEGEVMKAAAFIAAVAQDEKAILEGIRDDQKGAFLVHGIVEAQRGEIGGVVISWSKIRPGKLSVKLKEAFKDFVVLSHPAAVEREYAIRGRRNFEFGADAGVIYSDTKQPTWKAIDDPSTAGTEKIVTRTDETTSAGDVAVFFNFTPLRYDRIQKAHMGFQIGAGSSTSNPSLLAGVTFQAAAIRLGFGWNWQKVQDLARGVRERGETDPSVVADNDAIRTRSTFDNSWYISLSIALDDLPFFKQ